MRGGYNPVRLRRKVKSPWRPNHVDAIEFKEKPWGPQISETHLMKFCLLRLNFLLFFFSLRENQTWSTWVKIR